MTQTIYYVIDRFGAILGIEFSQPSADNLRERLAHASGYTSLTVMSREMPVYDAAVTV